MSGLGLRALVEAWDTIKGTTHSAETFLSSLRMALQEWSPASLRVTCPIADGEDRRCGLSKPAGQVIRQQPAITGRWRRRIDRPEPVVRLPCISKLQKYSSMPRAACRA